MGTSDISRSLDVSVLKGCLSLQLQCILNCCTHFIHAGYPGICQIWWIERTIFPFIRHACSHHTSKLSLKTLYGT